MEIVSFAINLEHIGDIIDKNLCELALKKIKRRYQFSPEGAAELTAFHKRVCESLQIAFGVFMRGDVEGARQLLREKAELRGSELAAGDRHFERLREGRPESIETSSLHLDILARPQAHPLSHLFGRLPGAGSRRRITRPRDGARRGADRCSGLSAEAAVIGAGRLGGETRAGAWARPGAYRNFTAGCQPLHFFSRRS